MTNKSILGEYYIKILNIFFKYLIFNRLIIIILINPFMQNIRNFYL